MYKEFLIRFIDILTELLIWIMLIRIVISWFRPNMNNPVFRLIYAISEPMIRLGQRIIPPTRLGIDFSPIVIFLGLELLRMLLVNMITAWIP